MSRSGIYIIENLITHKIYIGSALNLNRRKYHHFYFLKNGNHDNSYLQRSFNKYGIENILFWVLEIVNDKNNLIEKEQYYLDLFQGYYYGVYNLRKNAKNNLGMQHSKESIEKMRKAHEGNKRNPLSDETKAKIRDSHLGKHASDETKKKMSDSRKGNKNTLGYKHKESSKHKMSVAHKGKAFSEEHKAKISAANIGKHHTSETKRILSIRLKGRVPWNKGVHHAELTCNH